MLKLILIEKKKQGITWDELAKELPITGDSLRISFKRKSVSDVYVDAICDKLKIKTEQVEQDKKETNAIQVDFKEMNVMHVPLVNQYAQAGYLNGFADEEYIEELPTIPFANDVENKGDYMCFEVKGDSMDDGTYQSRLEGDILLCRNVRKDFWMSKLHINKWDFVIVHREKGILVKRITEHNVEKGILKLHSLNEYYDDFEVDLRNVDKIFNIVDYRRKANRR